MNFHPMDWLVPIQAIGWTLLHFLWQGGLVGLAYAIMRRLVAAEPRVREHLRQLKHAQRLWRAAPRAAAETAG